MTELPLLIVDVQRGGPSTGCPPRPSRPTCCGDVRPATEESPVAVLAASSPSDCFEVAIRGRRADLPPPVILLSDGCDRKRLRGLADPGPRTRRSASNVCRGRGGFAALVTRRPWPVSSPSGYAGPGAPHRRPGESRRHRRDLVRSQPRPHGPLAAGQDRWHRVPDLEVDDPWRRRVLLLGWGLVRAGPSARPAAGPTPGVKIAARQLRLNPFPPTSARCCGATRRWWCRR